MFTGILVTKDDAGYRATLQQIDGSQLGDGDVTVRVEWSTLNYKDGLALTGASPVVRRFPLVPGIDFAGTVTHSAHASWKPGDKVISQGVGNLRQGASIKPVPAGSPQRLGGAAGKDSAAKGR